MKIKRGDIFWVNNYRAVGCEYTGPHPCVVVSNDACNEHSPSVQVVYLTTASKKPMPTHVTIWSRRKTSTALCETITLVDKSCLGSYKGCVTARELAAIDRGLAVQLGLRARYEREL